MVAAVEAWATAWNKLVKLFEDLVGVDGGEGARDRAVRLVLAPGKRADMQVLHGCLWRVQFILRPVPPHSQ